MKNWKELSYNKDKVPFMSQMSYSENQRIYNLFCERLSYTRTRAAPLRRKVSMEQKQRFMTTIYGKQIATSEDSGGEMFAGIPEEHVNQFHKVIKNSNSF